MIPWLRQCIHTLFTNQQAAVRKEVASAIIKAVCAVKSAEITPDKVVVRFGEAVDGWPLPDGHTHKNVDLPPTEKMGK